MSNEEVIYKRDCPVSEQKVIVAILQHTLHRINEFLDTHPAENFAGQTPEAISTEFAHWLSKKDADL